MERRLYSWVLLTDYSRIRRWTLLVSVGGTRQVLLRRTSLRSLIPSLFLLIQSITSVTLHSLSFVKRDIKTLTDLLSLVLAFTSSQGMDGPFHSISDSISLFSCLLLFLTEMLEMCCEICFLRSFLSSYEISFYTPASRESIMEAG